MIIIIFCFFSNTILPTFRYWKIKIPIYSLYKKEAFKSTRNRGLFFFLLSFDFLLFIFLSVFLFVFLYTEKVDKMLGGRGRGGG